MAYADTSVRATSLMISAALLSAAVLTALTMRLTVMATTAPPDFTAVEMVRPTPPPKPPETPPQPTRPLIDSPIAILDAPAPAPIETAPQTPTSLPTVALAQPPIVSEPRWTRRPRDLARFYPARARSLGIEGEVTLDCMVSMQGALGCVVARESPPGWGFGDSALRIAREHRMVPAQRDVQPIEARYRMRLPFQLD
jgi:protein TonB